VGVEVEEPMISTDIKHAQPVVSSENKLTTVKKFQHIKI
jgi:hypothetical protein